MYTPAKPRPRPIKIYVKYKNKKLFTVYDSVSETSSKAKLLRDKCFLKIISGHDFSNGMVELIVKIGDIEDVLGIQVVNNNQFKYQMLIHLDPISKFPLIQDEGYLPCVINRISATTK